MLRFTQIQESHLPEDMEMKVSNDLNEALRLVLAADTKQESFYHDSTMSLTTSISNEETESLSISSVLAEVRKEMIRAKHTEQ